MRDFIAYKREQVAESTQSFVEFGVSDFVYLESFQCALSKVPLLGYFYKVVLLGVYKVDDWGEGHEDIELMVQAGAERETREHLGRALGVTDVGKLLLASPFENVFNLGRSIVPSELKETVVEEPLIVLHWVQVRVLPRVNVASVISEPDVVALFGQLD